MHRQVGLWKLDLKWDFFVQLLLWIWILLFLGVHNLSFGRPGASIGTLGTILADWGHPGGASKGPGIR